MALKDILSRNRSAILERWFGKTLGSYPSDAAGFLKQQKKQFANPVGYTTSKGLEGIFDGLLNNTAFDELTPFIDDVVRIRAIQDLTPSQALVFLFHLKSLIREQPGAEEQSYSGELRELDSRIDALSLISFDIYMKCREKVYELKANEVKNRTYRLLQMANLACEVRQEE
ncbi:MAG TPA: RsbRD N-terminal domain-containing protein [Thermodesulfovibrionales bacterium]|nr:RsbRD N-terminal domain-containing protein [Thermodesulfovibrionales bacterium]